ncbi:MAG: SHOCT domain-containing protein [Acidimicrobiales bacterium]
MPISNRQLLDGEEVILDMRPHWVVLAGPAILTGFAVAVAVAVTVRFPKAPIAVAWALAVMVAVPAVWLVARIAKRLGTSLILTTARLVLRRGVFGRDLVQLRLQRIVEVHYHQTLFERVIGTGRLIVEVNGESASIHVQDVRHPRRLQQALNHQMDAIAHGPDPSEGDDHISGAVAWTGVTTPPQGVAVTPAPLESSRAGSGPREGSDQRERHAPSIPDQLVQLDELRRRGILTPEEFEAKKADLLSRF